MSRFGCNTDENIDGIIESNILKNTVYSKKIVWKAFRDFCNDGKQSAEEFALILKY